MNFCEIRPKLYNLNAQNVEKCLTRTALFIKIHRNPILIHFRIIYFLLISTINSLFYLSLSSNWLPSNQITLLPHNHAFAHTTYNIHITTLRRRPLATSANKWKLQESKTEYLLANQDIFECSKWHGHVIIIKHQHMCERIKI